MKDLHAQVVVFTSITPNLCRTVLPSYVHWIPPTRATEFDSGMYALEWKALGPVQAMSLSTFDHWKKLKSFVNCSMYMAELDTWVILGSFFHRWVHLSDAFCVQSSPPACVPMCTTICTTFASHLGPPRPPMAKSGIFGQKWAILGPFFHRWVHLSDAFCVQSSPPACNPMCTTICTTFASHLGPPQPPMAKSGIFGQKWAIFWSFWYQIGWNLMPGKWYTNQHHQTDDL